MQNWLNSHLLEVQQDQVEYYHKSCSWFSRQTCLRKKRDVDEANGYQYNLKLFEIMQSKCSFHIECQRWLHSCYFYLWTAAGLSPSRCNQCQSEAVCFGTEFWSYPRASKCTHKVHEFFILTAHIKAIYRCHTLYWSLLNSKEQDDACTGWVHYVQQFNLWKKDYFSLRSMQNEQELNEQMWFISTSSYLHVLHVYFYARLIWRIWWGFIHPLLAM